MEGKGKTRRFIHFRRGTAPTEISPNAADLKGGPVGGVAVLQFPDPHITPSSHVLGSPPVGCTEVNTLPICSFRVEVRADMAEINQQQTPLWRWTAGGAVGQSPYRRFQHGENGEQVLNVGVVKPKKNLIY